MDNKLTRIGKVLKAHSLAGEVKVSIQEEFLEDFLQVEVIFIEVKGQAVPYFIEGIRENSLLVTLEGVKNRADAEVISKKGIFIRNEDLIPEDQKSYQKEGLEYEPYIGFMVQDITLGELGIILEILDYPQQEIAVLEVEGKEIMIPMVDAFVKEVILEKKIVSVELPDGILNL